MELRVDDRVRMKKAHPCGGTVFRVLRVGMDLRLRCETCGHEILVSRAKIEKYIKNVEQK